MNMFYTTISMGTIALAMLAGSAVMVTNEDSPHAAHNAEVRINLLRVCR